MDDPGKKREPAQDSHDAAQDHGQPDTGQAVVRQSDAPVDVPRPPAPAAGRPDEAAHEKLPRDDESVQHPWADHELPAPNATRVRQHNNV